MKRWFHVTLRQNPFGGQFTIACGLAMAIDFLRRGSTLLMQKLAYLGSQRGNDGKPLFDYDFLDYMRDVQLTCDIDAIPWRNVGFPEGTSDPRDWSDHSNVSSWKRLCSTF